MGGKIQLIYTGVQNIYLNGTPNISLFKMVYNRYTNFAMEFFSITLQGEIDLNKKLKIVIPRNGDLLGECYLQTTFFKLKSQRMISVTPPSDLPYYYSSSSDYFPAENIIEYITFNINDQIIDHHDTYWFGFYDNLYKNNDKFISQLRNCNFTNTGGRPYEKPEFGLDANQTVRLPLLFSFCRNPGSYLPLIALQYSQISFDIKISEKVQSLGTTLEDMCFHVNYVFLDQAERLSLTEKKLTYLIEQLQIQDHPVTSNIITKIKLNFNHPVKFLTWGYYQRNWVNTANYFLMNEKVYFNTSLAAPKIAQAGSTQKSNKYEVDRIYGSYVYSGLWGTQTYKPLSSDGPTRQAFVDKSNNSPLSTAKLVFNNQDLFEVRDGLYFNQLQPYYYFDGNPRPGIYAYSFSLLPCDFQPSGTCNFSAISDAVLEVHSGNLHNTDTLKIYAVNYNILQIENGMGGVLFSY